MSDNENVSGSDVAPVEGPPTQEEKEGPQLTRKERRRNRREQGLAAQKLRRQERKEQQAAWEADPNPLKRIRLESDTSDENCYATTKQRQRKRYKVSVRRRKAEAAAAALEPPEEPLFYPRGEALTFRQLVFDDLGSDVDESTLLEACGGRQNVISVAWPRASVEFIDRPALEKTMFNLEFDGRFLRTLPIIPEWKKKKPRVLFDPVVESVSPTVFVGGLPAGVTVSRIRELFSSLGHDAVTKINLITGKRIAFVQMKDGEMASKAAGLEGLSIGGCPLSVHHQKKNKGTITHSRNDEVSLFVGSCPASIKDHHIRDHLASLGTDAIVNIRWLSREGTFRGVGFVKMKSAALAERAAAMDPPVVDGNQLVIRLSAQHSETKKVHRKGKNMSNKPSKPRK